ncbi:MAG: hypothetical protein Q7S80_02785, partial [bacterium]|nr:hypothetical protein [bacterium]
KREFNSLQLLDGAILTHNPLDPSEMNDDTNGDGSLADEKTGSGRFRKVDLMIDSQVKLASGGSINVDKAGYPASSSTALKGYGVGGGGTVIGNGCARNENECLGGGAGYAGIGYAGSGSGSSGGVIYNNDPNITNDVNFEWGSAGGYSRPFAPGGSGGGRIRLEVAGTFEMSDDSSISANGDNGKNKGDPHGSFGGAGSGGTIKIVMSRYISGNSPRVSAAATGYVGDNGSYKLTKNSLKGTATLVNLSSNGSAGPAISSDGGFSADGTSMWSGGGYPNFLGSGSGGRIYIKALSSGGVTILKKLVANSRPGLVPANQFNPYSLQVGDTIEVDLTIGSYIGSPTIVDEMLTLPLGSNPLKFCKFNSGTFVKPVGTSATALPAPDGKTVTISNLPANSNNPQLMTYKCTVQ